jgi:hypothetical protein
LLVSANGCSISESVSDSISSPFESSSASSRSSSPEGRAESYQSDVRDYTIAYLRSGGDFSKFMNGLGGLAQKHGVTNWEADSNTYVGIGRGLKRAGVTPMQLEVYKTNLAMGDPQKAASIQQGFDQEK